MRLSLYCAFAALMALPAAWADTPAKPSKIGLCAACHGADGRASTPEIPNLAGQNLPYLRGAIAQYKSGKRDFPAMRSALGMLNAAEIDAIARWYATRLPRPATP
ncbi:MAG: c-type cytochrome [Xanthomonadaceae bacterium]|nr:c-type cytochrome [Xanthomonadaceae bacterium]MDE1885580.1 c-type cytochrome [Xanthomonadaceae bacterium]MDE1961180.1 c-type cytochrome [Xanthomonadaceae bacterium]MDE2083473.1 c-type cytochrome [Xanthomonadaceae bacterium]MDE2257488.1 c-type cytochrome [Xanthomonadaceae bacterium]